MSRVITQKEAFLKSAVYEDGVGGRVVPRMSKPEPTTDEKLVSILAEIRNAVVLNAQLLNKLPTGDNKLSQQIAANQDIMVQLLAEIKRAGLMTRQEKPTNKPTKWSFEIKRSQNGDMREIIATEA